MLRHTEIQSIIKPVINEVAEITLVYLFGSYADGTANAASDIDIAVLCKKGKAEAFYQQLQLELIGKLSLALKSDDIDVVILNTVSSTELKYNVIQDGVIIYDRDGDSSTFELRTRHEYLDHMAALRRAGLTKG